MTPAEHQHVADELNQLILDTLDLMDRFEAQGMDADMSSDYEQLQVLLENATQEFRMHVRAGLEKTD